MNPKIYSFGRKAIYALFVLIFVLVVNELFIGFNPFEADNQVQTQHQKLRVIYPDEPQNLDPNAIDLITRQRLINIYEPLVKFDRDLNVEPALALSWGLVSPTTWEFNLRPDVTFQDGSVFDVNDVVASLDRVRADQESELRTLLDTIEKIDPIDDLSFRLVTSEPDPLLLQRLTLLLISPDQDTELVGTGPYRFVGWERGDRIWLEEFANYWGGTPKFQSVEIISEANKLKRLQMLVDGEADFLAFVPFDAVPVLEEAQYRVESIPSLEVQFLLFNFDGLLSDLNSRQAVSAVVDQDYLVEAVGSGFARGVSQFVGNGVFGFNPKIDDHVYDLEQAAKYAENLRGQTIKLDILKGLDLLGDHLRENLAEIGVKLVVSYLDFADLMKSTENGDADIYFLGLKSDLGDSSGFLEDVAYSDGSFNIENYSSSDLDALIDDARNQMDPELRRQDLQDAMKIVVEDDYIGVPLFEYETVYGFSPNFDWEPRIDGLIYLNEIDAN